MAMVILNCRSRACYLLREIENWGLADWAAIQIMEWRRTIPSVWLFIKLMLTFCPNLFLFSDDGTSRKSKKAVGGIIKKQASLKVFSHLKRKIR